MTERDMRNLPSPVLERLAPLVTHLDDRDLGLCVQRGRVLEARTFSRGELRSDEEGNPTLDGYATVYDHAYEVYGGPERGGWLETVTRGAADKSVAERDDVRLLVNHDGIPLARTRSGSLMLESDKTGIRVESKLDAHSPLVQTVRSAMDRGDLDEMSFAFRVTRQEWNEDYTERSITEVQLFDVSLVTYPANPATVAQLRSLVAAPAADEVKSQGMSLALARALAESIRLGL